MDVAAPRKDDVKEIILDATSELMDEDAIDSISLAQIAAKAGISKGTLYYHYKAKEDILFDLTDRYLDQQEEILNSWMEDENKDSSFHRLFKYILLRDSQDSAMRMRIIFQAATGNDALRDRIVEKYQSFHSILTEKISERLDPALDADFIAWAALLMADGLIVQRELKTPGFDLDDFLSATEAYGKVLTDATGPLPVGADNRHHPN